MNESPTPRICLHIHANVFNFHDSIYLSTVAPTLKSLFLFFHLLSCLPNLLSMPQLDESKAYEAMVEALTTKNLELGERCGELEATVADLESSVQLSEELEVQQTEDMRELQVRRSR